MSEKIDSVELQRRIRADLSREFARDREGFLRRLHEKFGHITKAPEDKKPSSSKR